ncbi:MAG: small ligand-binding sensory domain FIST [Bradymonadia bacterium]|jgi:small ligand-binding sensory domain FIST
MRWASALAVSNDDIAAIDAALAGLAHDLDANPADIIFAFASADFIPHLKTLAEKARAVWPDVRVIGCSAAGSIGGNQEIEGQPALALTAASLPGVTVEPFHILHRELPLPDADANAWRTALGVDGAAQRHTVVLPDPFSMDPQRLLAGIERVSPLGVIIGGIASGGEKAGEHRLLIDDAVHRQGAVGVMLSGNLAVDTVVAQGCRPIGAPMFVTRCRRNLITELDGQSALLALQGLVNGLSPADRRLASESLFVGMVMQGDQQTYGQGDFLIRTLIGADTGTGALVVAARPEVNAVVQFHVRDAAASAADLGRLLKRSRAEAARPPAGALLFDCVGRGANFYGAPEHDTGLIRSELGAVPIGGFFCNGEIGPIHGRTHVHGFTASLGLFRPRFDS